MQKVLMALIAVATMAMPALSNAKGCLKGAVVGGAAGHVAGHHAVAGAAAGCVIQHHREKVRDKVAVQQSARHYPPLAAPGVAPSQ